MPLPSDIARSHCQEPLPGAITRSHCQEPDHLVTVALGSLESVALLAQERDQTGQQRLLLDKDMAGCSVRMSTSSLIQISRSSSQGIRPPCLINKYRVKETTIREHWPLIKMIVR